HVPGHQALQDKARHDAEQGLGRDLGVRSRVDDPGAGALEGSFWANAGVLALGVLAIGGVVLGLVRWIGAAGIGVTALVMILLGSPLSGVQTAPEMVPAGWGHWGSSCRPAPTDPTAATSQNYEDPPFTGDRPGRVGARAVRQPDPGGRYGQRRPRG